MITADYACERVSRSIRGLPVYLAGSAAALISNSHIDQTGFDDVDLFTATPAALFSTVERLRANGFEFEDRFERVYEAVRSAKKAQRTERRKAERVRLNKERHEQNLLKLGDDYKPHATHTRTTWRRVPLRKNGRPVLSGGKPVFEYEEYTRSVQTSPSKQLRRLARVSKQLSV